MSDPTKPFRIFCPPQHVSHSDPIVHHAADPIVQDAAPPSSMDWGGGPFNSRGEEAPEPYCVLCEKDGHLTTECWSTHALNTPRDRELMRLANDALRYRCLRETHWWDDKDGLVVTKARNIKLGSDVPSLERLDEQVDEVIAKRRAR